MKSQENCSNFVLCSLTIAPGGLNWHILITAFICFLKAKMKFPKDMLQETFLRNACHDLVISGHSVNNFWVIFQSG